MAERLNGGSNPAASPKGLTVDEMLERYPKEDVEHAIYSRDYVGDRKRLIEKYQHIIARGFNVEIATKALDELLEHTPSEPPIDPDEPADLDPDVLWRIKVLKYMYRNCPVVRPANILELDFASVDPETVVNRDAILNAYRRGDLKVVSGQMSVWFAGNLVIGPVPESEFSLDDLVANVPEWRKKYGPGRVWEERPCRRYRQRKCQGILPAADDNWTHLFSVRARLIGQSEFISIDNILDDTGSDFLELFSRDDCIDLGLTLDYEHWDEDVELEISSHDKIKRPSILIDVQLVLNGASFGPVFCVRATITPGKGEGRERCSGMGLRRHLFTATSPYGDGDLHLSDMKTGVTAPLRAKPK
ncbi:hypothetical protein PHISP_08319 [Aspergillus sp. HF37]|nr:hypothetical protein PHISP_08319 [Aspergillus sp. HF37]